MTNRRLFTIIGSLAAAGGLGCAQIAPPVPAAPPTPMAAPAPMPMPAAAPLPPLPPLPPGDFNDNFDVNVDLQIDRAEIRERVEEARAQAESMRDRMAYARGIPPMPAFAPQININTFNKRMNGSEDSLYQRGTSALDAGRWDEAAQYFTEAASKSGPRADGALYWKAYALKKMGKKPEALAAIAELRKSYGSSRWMDDAKALELDLGKPVSPEAETDEELKLLALNGIMQTDPERAIPLVENQLKGAASPKVKRNALFVLAQSSNPKAQAAVEQIARGGGNPDLQVKAITYLSERRRTNAGQILSEIYAATNDTQVKRAVLQAYVQNRDKDRLLAAVKNEKSPELRSIAISYLGSIPGNAELWQLYQSETTVEGKEQILQHMYNNSNTEKLLEVVRTEKEPRLRRMALQVLASQRNGNVSDSLVQIYNSETDPQMKNSILDGLSNQRNATALIAMAKAEKDPKMKLRIVERISNMASHSKEAAAYLEELLK
jgi:hypothetical protein